MSSAVTNNVSSSDAAPLAVDSTSLAKKLVATESPAMKFALELSATIFPGSNIQVEKINDPDDPERSWYAINIRWRGSISDSLARETAWHNQFDLAYGVLANDFAICVDLS